MHPLVRKMFKRDPMSYELGLLVLRLGVGLVFVTFGTLKFLAGEERFLWLGAQMANLGITFWPLLWGVAAAASEFFGGLSLVLGLGIRLACLFLAANMFVAITHHFAEGDPFQLWAFPVVCMTVLAALFITGAGRYSYDYQIDKKLL